MYVTYTRIYGWSDYGGESSYQPGYRLENMMWMTLLVYDYIIPGREEIVSVSWLLHLVLLFYCCFGKWLCSAGSDADALFYKDSSTSENISCNLPKWILL